MLFAPSVGGIVIFTWVLNIEKGVMSCNQEEGGDMEMQDAPALHTASGGIVDEQSQRETAGMRLT